MIDPAIFALLIPIVALSIPVVAIWTKHREKMAGLGHGTGTDASLRQTVDLLTQTLEKQHERQQALTKRIETLEAIATAPDAGRLAATEPRLALPNEEAPATEAAPATRTRTGA